MEELLQHCMRELAFDGDLGKCSMLNMLGLVSFYGLRLCARRFDSGLVNLLHPGSILAGAI